MNKYSKLHLFNTLTKKEEEFKPITEGFVGMYVCGPTVYGDPHLGHARAAVVFDVLYRYLKHLGYKVRYVRNITDVGHLEHDADEGEDKIQKKARAMKLEPMEIAHFYTLRYRDFLKQLNCLNPSIEPLATGHIPEQIKIIKKILDNNLAYVVNGSVYFDVVKYSQVYNYGILSGRNLDELIYKSRQLKGTSEKKHPADFALWKKADEKHIMRWDSPWSIGYPGWHIECTALSTKYLGLPYDIHGGGIDLIFPHHESEIAQSNAYCHPHEPNNEARYWIHNNLITINGQKMSKSLGNFITLEELFTGNNKNISKAYSPQVLRFFLLRAYYRKPLDFSDKALQQAEEALKRLWRIINSLKELPTSTSSTFNIEEYKEKLYTAINRDLNTPELIANIFNLGKISEKIKAGELKISTEDKNKLLKIVDTFVREILGLEDIATPQIKTLNEVLDILIEIRQQARREKNFALADKIRDELNKIGIVLRDTPTGTIWEFK